MFGQMACAPTDLSKENIIPKPVSVVPTNESFDLTDQTDIYVQGESAELKVWQDRFSEILGRKISSGETVGILSRICSTRLSRLNEQQYDNMMDLIEHLIEGG
jgi:hypothetical protein